MKKFLVNLMLLTIFSAVAFAAPQDRERKDRRPPMMAEQRGENRAEAFKKFMEDKIDYLVHEMKLSENQTEEFEKIYRELQREKFELMKKHTSAARQLRRMKRENPNTTIDEALYRQAIEGEYQLNIDDAQLEKLYLEKFSKVLTPKQLYEYLHAEKRFKQNFMNKRGAPSRPHHED